MTTLEKTICATKLKVLRNITFTEQENRCRNCLDYNKPCYIEYNPNLQIPINKGVVAYQLTR
jgi:hypothetical protein